MKTTARPDVPGNFAMMFFIGIGPRGSGPVNASSLTWHFGNFRSSALIQACSFSLACDRGRARTERHRLPSELQRGRAAEIDGERRQRGRSIRRAFARCIYIPV